MEYLLTSIIIEILLMFSYIKLRNRINNDNTNKTSEFIEGYELGSNKIIDDFIVNKEHKTIVINGISYKFSEIVSAEIKENVTETQLVSGINKYNTLYGVSTNRNLVSKILIEIRTNDMNNPFLSVYFLNLRIGVSKNSKKYKKAYNTAQQCFSILQIIIKENNEV